MDGHIRQTNDSERHGLRWARGAIAVATVVVLGFGVSSSALGQDIAPWQVCEATQMPVAVDFGGLAAPNVVLDADTSGALLRGIGNDPSCEIYNLPPGI